MVFALIVRVFVYCAKDLHNRLIPVTVLPEAIGLTYLEEAVAAFAVLKLRDRYILKERMH